MATMNLEGPYRLAFDDVTAAVKGATPGVFALGYRGARDVFYINYIGRADADIRTALLEFIGSDRAFKFKAMPSAEAAFHRECELFHAFRPPGNRIHPARAKLSAWTCPRCSLLDLS